MSHIFSQIKSNKIKFFGWLFLIIIITFFGFEKVNAQWNVPSSLPPDSNIFSPLNVGPYKQAKEGGLLLDPFYNPFGAAPEFDFPLEVRGTNDVYINNLEISSGGDLIVDTDTLYVDGEFDKVGIGTTTFEDTSTLEIHGGTVNIGRAGAGVTGRGLEVNSNSLNEYITATTTGSDTYTVRGQGEGNTIGVYGLNASTGVGIYARSNDASAVSGSVSSIYNPSGNIIAGIYGQAKGLGSWAGYFEQRLYSEDEIVANKFVPNTLQNSEIPYTVGWPSGDIVESELIDLNVMTFDGQYIYAHSGTWNTDQIIVIDPDNMEIIDRIILASEQEHNFNDVIDGGGYIWTAESHNYGNNMQSSVTRIDPADNNSYEIYYIYPNSGIGTQITTAMRLLYDDQTTGGPYIWVLNKLNYGPMHSITQMDLNGNIIRTFSLDTAANGGNKCSTLAMYSSINQCTDRLDNNMNGTIDSGVCTYNVADQAACTTAGGNWQQGCTDRTYGDATTCTNGGAIWAGTCSQISCRTQNDCQLCSGTGTWNGSACDGDPNCSTEATCEGTITCNGIWAAADNMCLAGADLGSCSNITYSTWDDCVAAGANWTWNNSTNDERIAKAYMGLPMGLTQDGNGNIWVIFLGAPDWDNYYYAGEGYAKFNASNPENASTQYVYCSGPDTKPIDITYDVINDQLWAIYYTNFINDNRGIAKINPTNGQVNDFLSYPTWQVGQQIEYYMGTPGGPSIWVNFYEHSIAKINASTDAVQNTYYVAGNEFDFDLRDPNNPLILQTTGTAGAILEMTMDNPPGYNVTTKIIKGSQPEKMIFDGTNIWVANNNTTILSKYDAKTKKKLGQYDVGVSAEVMTFDGQAIWVPYWDGNLYRPKYKKVDIVTGSIEDYLVSPDVGNTYYTADTVFDGNNIWQAVSEFDLLVKTNLSTCNPNTFVCPDSVRYNLPADTNPSNLIYDGEFIWVFYHDSTKVSKFSTNPITLQAELTLPDISTTQYVDWHYDRINAVEFDGTHIWAGTHQTDGDGNSIYKFNPKGVNKNDNFAGVCSNNSSINCNFTTDCGGNQCNAFVEGKFPVFHMPGDCSTSGNSCMRDADCSGTQTCNGIWTRVTSLTFDGINMWATHEGYSEHNSTGNECSDNADNSGNGQCDYDGAVGYPGCSGKPDPGCSNAADTLERIGTNSQYTGANRVLTRIKVATGEIVESMSINSSSLSSAFVSDAVFDGTNIWLGGTDFNGNTLKPYYTGSSNNSTSFINNLLLTYNIPQVSSSKQSGGVSILGAMSIGGKLIIDGDLVIQNNTWGGTADNVVDFGAACTDGEFVKGIGMTTVLESFGTGGYVRDSGIDSAYGWGIAVDSASVYLVGNEDNNGAIPWRTEKRNKINGIFENGFGNNGVVVGDDTLGNSSTDAGWDIAIDNMYMYVVGQTRSNEWHIEKRLKQNGNQEFEYNVGGGSAARAIAIDSQYMYVTGQSDTNIWRTEKRLLSTGALCTGVVCGSAFDGDGYVESNSATSSAHEIAIDGTYMYVMGFNSSLQWRIEKRLLTTGALVAGFGAGGIITESGVTVESDTTYVGGVAVDDVYLYVAGMDDNGGGEWHIRKYNKTTGALCNGVVACAAGAFDGDGVITVSTNIADGVNSIVIDNEYMYLIGYRSLAPDGWYMEKRRLDTGALCTGGVCGANFGDGGSGSISIYSNTNPNDVQYGRDIAIDINYIYTFGNLDATEGWRIEKRNKLTGALDNIPGALQCRPL